MQIRTKRIYEDSSKQDGTRVLVDRVWPRGKSKDEAALDHWIRDLAPSTGLRKWFGHDPDKWPEFRRRYARELDENREAVDELLSLARRGRVTLLFGAKDERHNNAVALKEYLERKAGQ